MYVDSISVDIQNCMYMKGIMAMFLCAYTAVCMSQELEVAVNVCSCHSVSVSVQLEGPLALRYFRVPLRTIMISMCYI